MIRGLPASIVAHAAVLGLTYVSLPYWGSSIYIPPTEAVSVTIADIGEINNIMPEVQIVPEEEAVPEDIPEETMPEEDFDEELPETVEEVATPEAAPETDPADILPDFEKPEKEEEVKEEEPEDKPEPKPEPPEVDPLAALLNQSESTFQSEIKTKRNTPPPAPKEDEKEEESKETRFVPPPPAENDQRGAGEQNANVVRLESLIDSRIRNECWAGVDDLPYPEKLNVQMSLKLNANGTVSDLRLISPTRRPLGNSPMGTAVDRALRAVNKCAPYRLPREDYELWKEVNIYLGLGFTKK